MASRFEDIAFYARNGNKYQGTPGYTPLSKRNATLTHLCPGKDYWADFYFFWKRVYIIALL